MRNPPERPDLSRHALLDHPAAQIRIHQPALGARYRLAERGIGNPHAPCKRPGLENPQVLSTTVLDAIVL
jgi:hypothetical protein